MEDWRKEQVMNERGNSEVDAALSGSNLAESKETGHVYLVDETELDLYLVSEDNPSKVLGKPVMYAVTDVKSGMVVAVKVKPESKTNSVFRDLLMTFPESAVIRYTRGPKGGPFKLETISKDLGMKVEDVKSLIRSMEKLSIACQHSIRQRHLLNKEYANRTPLTLTDVTDILTEAVCHYNEELEAVE